MMAVTRWIMVDLSDQQIVHVGACMYEYLSLIPCPDMHAIIVAVAGDVGQYWNGTEAQDDPIPPP